MLSVEQLVVQVVGHTPLCCRFDSYLRAPQGDIMIYDDEEEDNMILDEEDAKKQVLKYNQILQEQHMFKPILGRTDPRSILHGL